MFKCVPLNHAWTADTKLDIHAIYKRRNGDLMTLPMRGHAKWMAKGFEYVTLADAESFKVAIPFIRSLGVDHREFICGIDGTGRDTCWDVEQYLANRGVETAAEDAEIKGLVEKYGVELVEQIKGTKVPAHLKPEAKKATAKAGAAA